MNNIKVTVKTTVYNKTLLLVEHLQVTQNVIQVIW